MDTRIDEPAVGRLELLKGRLQRLRARLRAAVPFAAGIAAALAALLIYRLLFPPPEPLTQNQINETVAQAMASATPPPAYSTRVYAAVQPSLVLIQASFPGEEEGETDEGLGSGIVVNERGDILTSLHVVDGAQEIRLFFADGTEAFGQIIGSQPENDIAVLASSELPTLLRPAVLGNPNAMRVGDEVFAVGNPFGLYSSMSAGVVSGFERSFKPQDSDQRIENLIQFDAAVNPGNSGGPLLNRYGQVVGIVVGIVNPTEDEVFIGIGFAVPIEVAAGAAGMPPH